MTAAGHERPEAGNSPKPAKLRPSGLRCIYLGCARPSIDLSPKFRRLESAENTLILLINQDFPWQNEHSGKNCTPDSFSRGV
jgi:hypothetical protein